ncbi:MAG: cobalt-precorrin-6A reductase [Hyphomicrobiales bacterium]
MKRVLILGGTMDGRTLADRLANVRRLHVILSLAGRTSEPRLPKCDVISGGFGGADGLADYLEGAKIDILIDATHPFANKMSQSAATASAATGIPCFRLERKAWKKLPEDDWQMVTSIKEAVDYLPKNARVLATVGRQEVAPFFERLDIKVTARMIEAPDYAPRAPHKVLRNRPPYRLEDEILLMRTEHISHLVTKNSGGKATSAKLHAARKLGVKVVMVERPTPPQLPTAHSVDAMVAKIAKLS